MAGGRRAKRRRVPTVWRVPDDLWNRIAVLLPIEEFRPTGGRQWIPPRRILDGVLYVLRTGCQWKAVPQGVRRRLHGAPAVSTLGRAGLLRSDMEAPAAAL
jgi:transposase